MSELTPPPVATRREAINEKLFGQNVADPYRWLEDENAPEVKAWMSAQDKRARDTLAKLPGRKTVEDRLAALLHIEAWSPPVVRGKRYFYERRPAGQNKSLLYYKDGDEGDEHVLLDPNQWEGGTVSLGSWNPSWDGKKVVFGQRPNAADAATLHVVDVATQKWSEVDVIPGAQFSFPQWTPDNKSILYSWTSEDSKVPVDQRPGTTEIRMHVLGKPVAQDKTLHAALGDPEMSIAGSLSHDGKFITVEISHGWNESAIEYQRLGKDKTWKLLAKKANTHYSVEVWKDEFYITTDEDAPNGRVFKTSVDHPERSAWKELVPEDKHARLESAGVAGGKLVLTLLKDVHSEIRVHQLGGEHHYTVTLPGLGSVGAIHGEPDQDRVFFAFTSFTTPTQILESSAKTGSTSVWARNEAPVDSDAYVVQQVFFPSKDGTRIPMFIVRRKDVKPNGHTPTLLTGYGGFDVSLSPTFRTTIFPWLDAGGVMAEVNLRGGGEYGTAWHDAGKLKNKQNVFDDFAAAARYLEGPAKITSADRLAIEGGSNGGLLMGAAMTQHPELYGAVICRVPLLDMLRYQKFGHGRVWISEYGNAEKEGDFPTLYAYSPYHHVQEGTAYPPLLMMSSDHDDRVDPMHARKFVAEVAAATHGKSPVLLRIEAHAGHGGADRVDQAISAETDKYVFLFEAFKMNTASPAAKP